MYTHPDIQRQLADDRRSALIRRADETRLRREVRAIRRQLRRTG